MTKVVGLEYRSACKSVFHGYVAWFCPSQGTSLLACFCPFCSPLLTPPWRFLSLRSQLNDWSCSLGPTVSWPPLLILSQWLEGTSFWVITAGSFPWVFWHLHANRQSTPLPPLKCLHLPCVPSLGPSSESLSWESRTHGQGQQGAGLNVGEVGGQGRGEQWGKTGTTVIEQ